MVLGNKTNFCLGKTKKTILLDFGRIVSQKIVFVFILLVSLGKIGFPVQSYLFPNEHSKTILLLMKKTKKTRFESLGA